MDLFYIEHFYKSVIRKKSFDGEVLAWFMVIVFMISTLPVGLGMIISNSKPFEFITSDKSDQVFVLLIVFWLSDQLTRQVFRLPFPLQKYYLLQPVNLKSIAAQYLLVSFFSALPLGLFLLQVIFFIKTAAFFTGFELIGLLTLFISGHYLALITQFGTKWVRIIPLALLTALTLAAYSSSLLSIENLRNVLLSPLLTIPCLLISILYCWVSVSRLLNKQIVEIKKSNSNVGRSFSLGLKNPIYQLDLALIWRNKRTRTNVLTVLLLFPAFLINYDKVGGTEAYLLICFLFTHLITIQHGAYSFGWEGSFFDFLVANVRTQKLFESRWNFYLLLSTVGFLLVTAIGLYVGVSVVYALMIYIYSIGFSIPLILYRNLFHDTKIDLRENAFFNYSGVLTGPLMVSSIILLMLPLLIYIFSDLIMPGTGPYALGGAGIPGLLFRRQIISFLTRKFEKRKYHLIQAYK